MTQTKNIFNYLQTDPENIDEKTIYENTGVNPDNVKELVMNKIHESKSVKKNTGKIIRFTLIAAAAAAILGTSVAAAAGTFNPVFGQLFAGEAPNGAYTGGNVKVNSNDLDIDFAGVLGDANTAYSMMTITKKDGSAFVENSKDVMIAMSYNNYCTGNVHIVEGTEYDPPVKISHSLLENVFGDNRDHSGKIFYYFEDDNTITAEVNLHDLKNLIGSTMKINESKLMVWREDEVIFDKAALEKAWGLSEEEFEKEFGGDLLEAARKEYEKRTGHALAENQQVMYGFNENGYLLDDEGHLHSIIVAHYDTIDFKYDISVKLNYKDTSVSFDDMIGKELNWNDHEQKITSFEVTPFKLTIETEFYYENPDDIDYENDDTFFDHDAEWYNLAITLDNGQTYYAENTGWGEEMTDADTRMFEGYFEYSVFRDSNGNSAMINPSKIVSIKSKTQTLYSK